MKIHVRLYGPLRDQLPAADKGRAMLDLAEGATVLEIFLALDLPHTLLATINNDQESFPDTVLNDGDVVALFTPVSGG